jgi:hypothetical protein
MCCVVFGSVIFFSPYGNQKDTQIKCLENTVSINVPACKVYNYLGNSDNASKWSAFVDHITPLNAELFKDGEVGSIRRCFKNKDESGMFWDEETLINEKNKIRQLSVYNMSNINIDGKHIMTEQIYNDKSGQCELTFKLFFKSGLSGWFDELKMYVVAYRVSSIFDDNLNRIKQNLEQNMD